MSEKTANIRYDVAGVSGRSQRTEGGFLRAPATIARPGVLTYRFADGTSRRELVLPDELFATASLDSLRLLPLTDDHPVERVVTTDNIKRVQVGQVGERVRKDGNELTIDLLVTDAVAIGKVNRGKRQLSAGYTCDIEASSGVWEGEAYDAIQRNRRYNHVAIVDTGRAGPKAKIHLDAADPVGISFKESVPMTSIKIDGVEIEIEQTQAALIQAALDKREQAATKLTAELEAAKARNDGLTAELETERKARTDAQDPKHVDAAVQARLKLERTAAKLLGAEVKLDSLDNRQVMEMVCVKHQPAIADKLKTASAEYLAAAYDFAVDAMSVRQNEQARAAVEKVRQDGDAPAAPASDVKTDSAEMLKTVRDKFIAEQNKLKPLPKIGLV